MFKLIKVNDVHTLTTHIFEFDSNDNSFDDNCHM